MAWITITKEHVRQRATTIETGTTATIGADGTDVLQGITDATTVEIRAAISQNSNNRLSENASQIPESLLNCALALIVYRLASRALTQEILVQDARYQEYSRALQTLDKVRTGEIEIEDPETGEMTSSGSSVQIVESAPFRFTRRGFSSF